jgi:hypothetical protein
MVGEIQGRNGAGLQKKIKTAEKNQNKLGSSELTTTFCSSRPVAGRVAVANERVRTIELITTAATAMRIIPGSGTCVFRRLTCRGTHAPSLTVPFRPFVCTPPCSRQLWDRATSVLLWYYWKNPTSTHNYAYLLFSRDLILRATLHL